MLTLGERAYFEKLAKIYVRTVYGQDIARLLSVIDELTALALDGGKNDTNPRPDGPSGVGEIDRR